MMRWNSFTLPCCVLTLAIASIGCTGEEAGAPSIPDSALVVKKLDLNHDVVMLTKNAPYDTVQLRAVPISLIGDTVPFDGQVIYYRPVLRDTSISVDSFTGMVRVRSATGNGTTRVIARLSIDNQTFYDTVRIMIRNDAVFRPVDRVEISPIFVGDSAVRWLGSTGTVSYENWARVYDTADVIIPANERLIAFQVQKPEVVLTQLSYPSVHGANGESYIYTRLYAYGQELRDSVLFRRIVPPIRFVTIDRIFPAKGDPKFTTYPITTHAKVGTTIFFMNMFGYYEYYPDDAPFGLGCLLAPGPYGSFCGNRVRYSTRQGSVGSELVGTDSIDINFDQPSMALVGDSYGNPEIPQIRFTPLPSDSASGNIPAFSVKYCKILVEFPDNDTCGAGFPTFTFESSPILDFGIRARKFTTPGTYHFYSTRYPDVSGTIIITP